MRVESPNSSLSAPISSTERVQQPQPAQTETTQKPQEAKQATNKSDTLDISKTSEQLNKTNTNNQQSDFRADKVAQVKKSIESNEYQVSSRAVAEKVLFAFSRGPTA